MLASGFIRGIYAYAISTKILCASQFTLNIQSPKIALLNYLQIGTSFMRSDVFSYVKTSSIRSQVEPLTPYDWAENLS